MNVDAEVEGNDTNIKQWKSIIRQGVWAYAGDAFQLAHAAY